MITVNQAAELARLVHAIRPDWDRAGIQAAALERAEQQPRMSLPLLAIEAIQCASVPSNRTPRVLLLDGPHRDPNYRCEPPPVPACPKHGGKSMRSDGTYGCCWSERFDPSDGPVFARDTQLATDHAAAIRRRQGWNQEAGK